MKQIDNFIYSVDENNSVRIWEKHRYDNGEPPFLFQPEYPTGEPFSDSVDAEQWAENHINLLVDAANKQPAVEE